VSIPPPPAPNQRLWLRLLTGGHGRPLGGAVLAAMLALLLAPPVGIVTELRMALFDTYQTLSPRVRVSAPAVIVAIDEKSLQALGQWPWPRTITADLIHAIAEAGPAAIGVDVLMPEADRMSPGNLARLIDRVDPNLAQRLAKLPSNDAVLAQALRRHSVALGVAGVEQPDPDARQAGRAAPYRVRGEDPAPFLRRFAGGLRSLDQLDAAARGHGLLSVDPLGGVVRRVPLAATVHGVLTPALSMETLRLASGAAAHTIVADAKGVKGVGVADLFVPTSADGAIWVAFGPHDEDRFVPAVDVLRGTADPEQIRGKIALIGATGLGLLDYQTTPLGERIPGIEIHAQILEGIFDGNLLQRPAMLRDIEAGLTLLLGGLLVFAVPTLRPRRSLLLYAGMVAGLLALGFALFHSRHLLLDVAWPALACTLVFGVMVSGALAEADAQRRALRRALEAEREAAARAAGELEAARRIQMGMLPPSSARFYEDGRFSLEALIETAKSVGGDLYDFFKLDEHRLFFMVGDVAGKGLPASIFMAVSKALYKSAALRSQQQQDTVIQDVMQAANREIARDNPEALFVTVFAGILDLRGGTLHYCNAGHDAPYLLGAGRRVPEHMEGEAGPPLCVIEDFPYRFQERRLQPGETLFLFTDGVTEAMDAAGELYGRQRLFSALRSAPETGEASAVVSAVRDDVRRFVGDVERSDDLTILALRWNGSGAS
jgi:serine phosphatase RsbU (regulator of sigma subunit)/CHASE2 domain-containing sensor protein